ncbi:MAG: hypothetical protein M3R53_08720, partial [Candidatus Eremiobacteraeota bacterium]|nr:hypothetical protein [Candidatus Eremiobacteraeota bacterium]
AVPFAHLAIIEGDRELPTIFAREGESFGVVFLFVDADDRQSPPTVLPIESSYGRRLFVARAAPRREEIQIHGFIFVGRKRYRSACNSRQREGRDVVAGMRRREDLRGRQQRSARNQRDNTLFQKH